MMKNTFLTLLLASTILASGAAAQTPPPVPAIADTDRTITYALSSPTTTLQVPFPVFGDCSDLAVLFDGVSQTLGAAWDCSSPSGALASLPLPIVNIVVTLTPSRSTGTVTINGKWHPRRVSQPTAPGINRREFNQVISNLTTSNRELFYYVNGLLTGAILPGAPPADPVAMTCAYTAGGFSTGGVDNAPKLSAWFSALAGTSGCIHFPGGDFSFNSLTSLTLAANQSIYISGAGQGTRIKNVGNHNWLAVTYAARVPGPNPNAGVLSLSAIRISTDQDLLNTAVTINGAHAAGAEVPFTVFDHVLFDGETTSDDWNKRIVLNDVAQVALNEVHIDAKCLSTACTDIGTEIVGTSTVEEPTSFKFDNYHMTRGGTGIYAHGHWEGVNITHSELVGQNIGLRCEGTTLKPECDFSDGHINAVTTAIKMVNIGDAHVTNSLIYQGAYAAISHSPVFDLSGVSTGHFTGNTLRCTPTSVQDGFHFVGSNINDWSGNMMVGCALSASYDAASSFNTSYNGYYTTVAVTIPADAGSNNAFSYTTVSGAIWFNNAIYAVQLRDASAIPVISSCGTSPAISASSSNSNGSFVTGTGTPAACTITFSSGGWPVIANCVVTPSNAAAQGIAGGFRVAAGDRLKLVVALGAGTNGAAFTYYCGGQ